MSYIPARDLRNNITSVLRRVAAGEHLRITMRGRPVAELVPLDTRPRSVAWDTFIDKSAEWRADAELAGDLHGLLPDTTDDVPVR